MKIFSVISIVWVSVLGSVEQSPKVVVVGAGIAGLTTAYRLQKGGMDVHLYEARNRVGGRVFTAHIDGRVAELGGQNIEDGGDAVHLKRLIDEMGLQILSRHVPWRHLYYDGSKILSIDEMIREQEFDMQALQKQLHELSTVSCNMQEILGTMFDVTDPIYRVVATRLAAYEGGSMENLSPLYEKTLFRMLSSGICSVHPSEEDPSVDLVTVDGGNALLPEKIASSLGDRLHLNRVLTRVAKNKEDTFQLTFANGEQVKADFLVLAIPCSVYEQIEFEHGVIPSQKLDRMRKIRYGENAKIIVPFATPSMTTVMVSDGIVSFFDASQQLLTVYYTGKMSFFSPETVAHSYRHARPMIEAGFGDACSSYEEPTYAKDCSHLSYRGPIGYSWVNDPYARGSYSYIASGQEGVLIPTIEENGETFKALFAPIQGQLYFAGEHTSILSEVPGTMEAACESGERTARAILNDARRTAQ
jgi:monoamine oxidase